MTVSYMGATLEEYEQVALATWNMPNIQMVSSDYLTISGQNVRRIESSCSDERGEYTQVQYIYYANGNLYMVNFMTLTNENDKYMPIIDAIMDSYKIVQFTTAM